MIYNAPAGSRFRHGDGANLAAVGERRHELVDLLLGAVVRDVGHHDLRVQGEAGAGAVHVAPRKRKDCILNLFMLFH